MPKEDEQRIWVDVPMWKDDYHRLNAFCFVHEYGAPAEVLAVLGDMAVNDGIVQRQLDDRIEHRPTTDEIPVYLPGFPKNTWEDFQDLCRKERWDPELIMPIFCRLAVDDPHFRNELYARFDGEKFKIFPKDVE